MDEKQEGIELETVDTNLEGIQLPTVEEETEVENEVVEATETTETTSIDEEKESLKRGVNKERKARKEAEKRAKELEARIKALEDANKAPEKSTLEELVESGIDENIARSISSAIDKKKADSSNLAKELADVKFENAITKKSREEGFEDIAEYSDEIRELVDKGLTIEQSYYAITYDKPKTKNTQSEIERKVEAKLQNNQARKEILGNYNNNSGAIANSKNAVKLSAEEKGMAAMVGMTAEEFAAYRDMESVKDYKKYIETKKN